MRLQKLSTWLIAGTLTLLPALALAQDAQGDFQVPEPETLGLLAAAAVAALVLRRVRGK